MIMAIMAMAKQPSSLMELEDIIELVCLLAIFCVQIKKSVLNVMHDRHFAKRSVRFGSSPRRGDSYAQINGVRAVLFIV